MAEPQGSELREKSLEALLAAVKANEGEHGTKEQFEELIKYLQSESETVLAATLTAIGDLARVAHNRDIIAALNPFARLVELLEGQKNANTVVRGVLRSLANLSFESPFARDAIRAFPTAIESIAAVLSSADSELRRVACGCIANVASNHEENCDDFRRVGALTKLELLAKDDDDDNVQAMAVRALRNLCDCEANRSLLKSDGFLKVAVGMLKAVQDDDNMVGELTALVHAMTETKTILYDFINEHDGIDALLDAMGKLEDVPVIADVADFLNLIAEREDLRDEFLKSGRLARVREMFLARGSEDSDDAVRLSMGRLYAALSASDAVMDEMFNDLDIFVKLLSDDSKEVQTIAAMTLGNLARTDAKVSEMISRGVAEALVNVVKNTETDLTVRHYCVSCLRNLSLPVPNKRLLFDLGVVKPAVALLSERMSPVLVHAALGLLRSLLLDDVVRAFLESGGAGLLGPLLEEESDHVRFEASRLIAQLCKDEVALAAILERKLYRGLSMLLTAKWDILMLEGAAGCALLGEQSEEARVALGVDAGIANELVEIIHRQSDPQPLDETKKVALKALATLCTSPKVARRLHNVGGVPEKLKKSCIATSQSDLVAQILTAVEAAAATPFEDIDSNAEESEPSKAVIPESIPS